MFLLFLFFVTANASYFPPGVKFCHRSDPNFQKCVGKNIGDSLKLFANGWKELSLPRLDPFFMEKLEITGSTSASMSLNQKYQNVYVYGSTNSNLEKYFELELDNGCQWTADVFTPLVRLEADYDITGNLLSIPINARGKCNITQINLLNRHRMYCEKYTKNNETYIRVIDYTLDMEPEDIILDYSDIFAGNEQISKEIQKNLNENSRAIFHEVKPGIEKAFGVVYIDITNRVFSRVPLNQIFLD